MSRVRIDMERIVDRKSFHSVFAEVFGFPKYYGRNMDAWIDCMTYLDDPSAGMSTIHANPPGVVLLELTGVQDFRQRCPELYADLIECAAFVNYRRAEMGQLPVIALSFYE